MMRVRTPADPPPVVFLKAVGPGISLESSLPGFFTLRAHDWDPSTIDWLCHDCFPHRLPINFPRDGRRAACRRNVKSKVVTLL